MLYNEKWENENKQAIDRAIALLEQGWSQGSFRQYAPDGSVSYCLMGALAETTENSTSLGNITVALTKILNRFDVSAWNDDPKRTKQQVIDALIKAKEYF